MKRINSSYKLIEFRRAFPFRKRSLVTKPFRINDATSALVGLDKVETGIICWWSKMHSALTKFLIVHINTAVCLRLALIWCLGQLYSSKGDGMARSQSDFRPPSEDFRRFSKIVPKARRTFPNIFRENKIHIFKPLCTPINVLFYHRPKLTIRGINQILQSN